mmetsp:Transcript_617/g.1762  ORF Transcript_617/g.1762 Transcript_617/m.1762 type:complete len:188 (-) Transcript_617:61-624(-)
MLRGVSHLAAWQEADGFGPLGYTHVPLDFGTATDSIVPDYSKNTLAGDYRRTDDETLLADLLLLRYGPLGNLLTGPPEEGLQFVPGYKNGSDPSGDFNLRQLATALRSLHSTVGSFVVADTLRGIVKYWSAGAQLVLMSQLRSLQDRWICRARWLGKRNSRYAADPRESFDEWLSRAHRDLGIDYGR